MTESVSPRPDSVTMHKRTVSEVKRLIDGPQETFAIPGQAHHLYQYLHLVEALGAASEPLPPHIAVTASEVAAIQERFGFCRQPGGPLLLGLNAGAEYGPAKRWPRERFAEAARTLQRQTKCHWWIFGGQTEQELARGIAAEIQAGQAPASGRVQSLAGLTSLRELCAALKACDLVLTNDTGPMHLAAAVDTRVVALFGSTSPELTGPGLPGEAKHFLLNSRVPCAPCFRRECPIDFRCMNSLSVAQVVAAVLEAAPAM